MTESELAQLELAAKAPEKYSFNDPIHSQLYEEYRRLASPTAILSLLADHRKALDKLEKAKAALEQFATLETVQAPDGRRWPFGVIAIAALKEIGD